MTPGQIKFLTTLGFLAAVVLILAVIWFIVWIAIFHPIHKKDALLKKRDDLEKEILKLKADTAVEWESYKELTENKTNVDRAYHSTKEKLDQTKDELTKLAIERDKLVASNRELRKQLSAKDKKDDK